MFVCINISLVSPVGPRQLQPVQSSPITYTTRQISAPQITGSLQPVPPAIPITSALVMIYNPALYSITIVF